MTCGVPIHHQVSLYRFINIPPDKATDIIFSKSRGNPAVIDNARAPQQLTNTGLVSGLQQEDPAMLQPCDVHLFSPLFDTKKSLNITHE